MKRLLTMTGTVVMLALESTAARMPAASFDSNSAALDTRSGTVGLSVDQTIVRAWGNYLVDNLAGWGIMLTYFFTQERIVA